MLDWFLRGYRWQGWRRELLAWPLASLLTVIPASILADYPTLEWFVAAGLAGWVAWPTAHWALDHTLTDRKEP